MTLKSALGPPLSGVISVRPAFSCEHVANKLRTIDLRMTSDQPEQAKLWSEIFRRSIVRNLFATCSGLKAGPTEIIPLSPPPVAFEVVS